MAMKWLHVLDKKEHSGMYAAQLIDMSSGSGLNGIVIVHERFVSSPTTSKPPCCFTSPLSQGGCLSVRQQREGRARHPPMNKGDHEGPAGLCQVLREDSRWADADAADRPQLPRGPPWLFQQQCNNRSHTPWHSALQSACLLQIKSSMDNPDLMSRCCECCVCIARTLPVQSEHEREC